jgi:hypothetical protein
MPAALYGVSFKKTGHLLAICSFEKRELADSTAAQQLLEDLVGKSLVISAWLRSPIKVDLDQLAADPLRGQAAPPDKIANVYGYQVQAGGGALGDGKEKDLALATGNTINKLELDANAILKVTLGVADSISHDAWVLFEGAAAPIKGTSTAGQPTIKISIPLPVSSTQSYGFLFLMDGIPATSAYVTV